MRIVRHSPQHITIHSPDLVLWILALVFLGASALILLVFGEKVTLNCDRSIPPAGVCTLETTSFIDSSQKQISVGNLQRAELRVNYGDSDSSDTYQVVLLTNNGELPFTDYYSSGSSKKQQLVNEINQFIQNDSLNMLSVKSDDRLWISILAGIFAGVGALMGIFSGITTLDLDRSSGLLTVSKRRLLSTSASELLLSDFQGAEIESSKNTYRVVLRMRDGKPIPITSYYSSGYKGKKKLADELQVFADSGPYKTTL